MRALTPDWVPAFAGMTRLGWERPLAAPKRSSVIADQAGVVQGNLGVQALYFGRPLYPAAFRNSSASMT